MDPHAGTAEVGSAGNSTGPHLRWETRLGDLDQFIHTLARAARERDVAITLTVAPYATEEE